MNKYSLIIIAFIWVGAMRAQPLSVLQEEAAENNAALRARYSAFEASLQRAAQAGGFPDPNLSFGYFINPVETRVGPQLARFSLSQRFPWFGSLKAKKNSHTLLAEAKYQEFVDAREKLAYAVAVRYYDLYELDRKVLLQEKILAVLQSYRSLALTKYENGRGTMVDVLRAEMRIEDMQSSISNLRKERKPLQASLNQKLNRELDSDVRVEPDSLEFPLRNWPVATDSGAENHPRAREYSSRIEAMELQKKSAALDGMPNLGLGVDYILVGNRPDVTIPDNGKDALVPMLSVSLPIFRAKYKAARREADLLGQSYASRQREVITELQSSIEEVVFEAERAGANVALYQNQVKRSAQALQILHKSYAQSGSDFDELLEMQIKQLRYQLQLIAAKVKYRKSRAEWEYLNYKSDENEN